MGPLPIGEGIEKQIDHPSQNVARIARPDQRDEQIGSFVRAINGQSLSEILVMTHIAPAGGRVDDAGDADGRIHPRPDQGHAGPIHFALQDVVRDNDGRIQMVEHVADRIPHRLGHDTAIDECGRAENALIHCKSGIEQQPVERLERIVDVLWPSAPPRWCSLPAAGQL